jgi:hypothetical protein
MADDRVERALEVFVYAPLGLGLWIRDLAPAAIDTVVARGRAEIDRRQEQAQQHITTARSMGQVAVAFGVPRLRRRAEQQINQARSQADRLVETVVSRTNANGSNGAMPASATAPATVSAPPPMHSPAPDAEPVVPEAVAVAAAVHAPETGTKSSSSGHLAIPGYDALSASQVVERLVGLSAGELGAVREYESGNRNRRTILGKIDQLTTA